MNYNAVLCKSEEETEVMLALDCSRRGQAQSKWIDWECAQTNYGGLDLQWYGNKGRQR